MYKYDYAVDKPIFDKDGVRLQWIPTARKDEIFNQWGKKLSKNTLKVPQKRGFALKENRKNINPLGRPILAKCKRKNTFKAALQMFENNQILAAEIIVATMMGDEKTLGGAIKVSDRVSASRYIIEAPGKMKSGQLAGKNSTLTSDDEEDEHKPIISLTL